MFGYSRPAVLSDIVPYKPTYVGNMANANVPDSTTKLTLDAKQEVTIDPRTVGLLDTDEMTITSISMRESYLTQCVWGQNGVASISAPGDVLFSSYVSPMLWALNTFGTREEIHLPACAFAALPFKYWRGTMKFRFQVVASNFHKGRLRISYDPLEPDIKKHEFNTNYTWIIDIAQQKDFTVEIGWGNQFPFLLHTDPGTDEVPYRTASSAGNDGNGLIGPTFPNFTNGYIGISVLNELTVPSDATDINAYINVFVSTGPDFEVANPTAENLANYAYFQQPVIPSLLAKSEAETTVTADQENTDNPSRPLNPETDITMASTISKNDGITAACVGEVIASFRQCLKRYSLHTVYGTYPGLTAGDYYYIRTSNHFPFYRGYAPGAINVSGVGQSYNYAKSTLLNYLTPAFTGWRGAIRYKTSRAENQNTGELGYRHGYMRYVRTPNSSTEYKVTFAPFVDAAAYNESYAVFTNLSRRAHGWEGQHMTLTEGNAVLEVEFPYINDTRFVPAKLANKTSVPGVDDSWHTFESVVSAGPETQVVFEDQVAIGEDFNLFFFTGAPIMYYYPSDPNP
jgi:hypothetical protein